MPRIFLSPSAQEGNSYVIGGSEEYYMNLVADAMEPYLLSTGIAYTRNNRYQTLRQIIDHANAGRYDLHFALHSNAAPEQMSGMLQGTDVYYYPTSTQGGRAAQVIADNFKKIYPHPEKVRAVPSTTIAELRESHNPAVLIEMAYHDNLEDAQWVSDNIRPIGRNLVQGLAQFFGIPFVEATPVRTGTVNTQNQGLRIRQKPSTSAPVLTVAPKGAQLTVYGKTGDWYVVKYSNIIGYAAAQYVQV